MVDIDLLFNVFEVKFKIFTLIEHDDLNQIQFDLRLQKNGVVMDYENKI